MFDDTFALESRGSDLEDIPGYVRPSKTTYVELHMYMRSHTNLQTQYDKSRVFAVQMTQKRVSTCS